MPRIAVTIRVERREFALDVDFALKGRRIAVLGPNGSGKTTLLKTLLGVHRPKQGRICLGEAVVFDSALGIELGPEERKIGYVPQNYGLFPHLTVWQNVAFALEAQPGSKRSEGKRLALELLKQWNVEELAERKPHTLSGGECQRVALARALAVGPEWLLLDEPFSALDVQVRGPLRKQLLEYLETQGSCGLLFVTHDWRDVEALATHVVVLGTGKVQYFGAVEEIGRDGGGNAPLFVRSLFEVESIL